MKKLKVGILGFGKMGKVYADYFFRNPNTELCAIYNHSANREEEVKSFSNNITFYTDWEKMLEKESLDIVGLCTATNERLAQIKKSIQNKLHIICELPVCLDLDELSKIKSIIKPDLYFRAASELMHHPVIKKVGEILPRIGDIFYIDYNYSMFREEIKWKHQFIAGGGILRELSQHFIDVIINWLGEASRVFAHNKVINPKREVEDFSLTDIEFKNGAIVKILNSYFDRSGNSYKGTIYGTKGQILFELSSYDVKDSKIFLYDDSNLKKEILFDKPIYIDKIYPGHMDSFLIEINNFVNDILYNQGNRNNLNQVYKNMQISSASYESERQKEVIKLPLASFSVEQLKEVATYL